MSCAHTDVEVLENAPLEGEIYGEMFGQCRSCLCYVKAWGNIESEARTLEPTEPWEVDQEAMREVCS